jgi:Immunity protein 30
MKKEDWIDVLVINKLIRSPDEAIAFEYALTELAKNPQPEDSTDLHLIFDDQCERSDVMFSLLHFLESFDLEEQLTALIEAIPQLIVVAPNWLKILQTRILNDQTARCLYRQKLQLKLQVMNDPRSSFLIQKFLEESEISDLSDRNLPTQEAIEVCP